MHIARPEDRIDSVETKSSSSLGKELASAIQDVIRSEVKLAKVEVSETTGKVGRDLGKAVAFGAFAAFGIFPLMAFLVIGFGDLIDNYWLSSLLVALGMFLIGGLAAMTYAKKIKDHDLSMPHTRDSFRTYKPVFDRAMVNVKSQVSHVSRRVKSVPRRAKEEITHRRSA